MYILSWKATMTFKTKNAPPPPPQKNSKACLLTSNYQNTLSTKKRKVPKA